MVTLPNVRRFIALSMFASAIASPLFAKTPEFISPVQTAPGTVTFRVFAPEAKSVNVQGLRHHAPVPMIKGAEGVWSATVENLPADIYSYTYDVDGTPTLDLKNRFFKRWINSENGIEITGLTPTDYAIQNVEHGDIHLHTYASAVGQRALSYAVYTPPGYDPRGHVHYPVIVLCHGFGDDAMAWVESGRVNFIADNLIAKGAMKKAVIVMPYGHPTPNLSSTSVPDEDPYWQINNVSMEQELIKEVLPFIESHYLVSKKAEERAIVGLSMGGGHALWVGLSHPELFHWVGSFSAVAPIEAANMNSPSLLRSAKETKAGVHPIWIGIGRDDSLVKRNEDFTAWLKQNGIAYSWHLSDGGHEWENWRVYFSEFAQTLFK